MSHEVADRHLQDWNERLHLAEASLPIIGRLYRESGVVTLLYGRPIIEKPPIDILREHRRVRQVEERELSIRDTYPLLEVMGVMKLKPCRIDLGKLAVQWIRGGRAQDPGAFVREHLGAAEGLPDRVLAQPQDVVLYGFGRIGRLLARLLIERTGLGDTLRLRAIVVRRGAEGDLHKRASLLRRDSVHGRFHGTIKVDEEHEALIANGHFIKVIYADAPENVDYEAHDITNAIIIDNTGMWRDEEGLARHLKSKGASKVILTAPGKGDIKNVVFGVNDDVICALCSMASASSVGTWRPSTPTRTTRISSTITTRRRVAAARRRSTWSSPRRAPPRPSPRRFPSSRAS